MKMKISLEISKRL